MIDLYYFPTPNGRKVAIALEEMGLPYVAHRVNILEGDQARPEFLAISPNGRIPALVDPEGRGGRVEMFESGAMLLYLGRKSGQFYPEAEPVRALVDAWVFWQMSGLGPMSGQVTYFRRAATKPGRDPQVTSFAIHRFEKETRRLYGVLEQRLQERAYICDEYSLADMACWPWVHQHGDYVEVLGGQFPAIADWYHRIAAREAVQRALLVGTQDLGFAPGR